MLSMSHCSIKALSVLSELPSGEYSMRVFSGECSVGTGDSTASVASPTNSTCLVTRNACQFETPTSDLNYSPTSYDLTWSIYAVFGAANL